VAQFFSLLTKRPIMQKLKANRVSTRYRPGASGDKQGFKRGSHKILKTDNGNQEPLKNTGNDPSGNSGDDQNKKERRFKDWRTSDIALPL